MTCLFSVVRVAKAHRLSRSFLMIDKGDSVIELSWRMSVRPTDIRVLEEQSEFACGTVPEALRMDHRR
jgi:hypothetical protein